MILASETGQPLFAGGLADQPYWATDLLCWFVPDYLEHQFQRRMKAIFGTSEPKQVTPPKPKK